MPGPRNKQAKKKEAVKKERARAARRVSQNLTSNSPASRPGTVLLHRPGGDDIEESAPSDTSGPLCSDPEFSRSFGPEPTIVSPSSSPVDLAQFQDARDYQTAPLAKLSSSTSTTSEDARNYEEDEDQGAPLLPQPCIHDPGNGPRVRDLFEFLKSRFVTPPSWDVPDCMEYHFQHVLDFLAELLPYETALILWYNKTRENARICPVCQRFYRLGDRLYSHEMEPEYDGKMRSLLSNEQDQSGLCSFVCFGVAGYNYPGVVKAWGKLDHELDDDTREMLNGSGLGVDDAGLGMYLKLTRQDDPGFTNLIELCHEEELAEKAEGLSIQ